VTEVKLKLISADRIIAGNARCWNPTIRITWLDLDRKAKHSAQINPVRLETRRISRTAKMRSYATNLLLT